MRKALLANHDWARASRKPHRYALPENMMSSVADIQQREI